MNYKKVFYAIFFITVTAQSFAAEKSILKITNKALFSGDQPNSFWKNTSTPQGVFQKNIAAREQWRNDLFKKMGIVMGGAVMLRAAITISKRIR